MKEAQEDSCKDAKSFVEKWFASRKEKALPEMLREIQQVQQSCMHTIAVHLTPHMNQWVALQAPSSIEEKRELAQFVNSQMASLGLAAICPKTGLPGYFVVESGENAKNGRFRLLVRKEPRGYWRTTSSAQIQNFTIGPLVTDGSMRWVRRSQGPDSSSRQIP